MKRIFSLLMAMTLPMVLGSCLGKKADSALGSQRNNALISIYKVTLIEGTLPGIPGTQVPVVVMTDSRTKEKRGFAIDCPNFDAANAIYRSFGFAEPRTIRPQPLTADQVLEMYKVNEQPIIRCDDLVNNRSPIREVFRVIHDVEGKPFPNYLVKMRGFEQEFFSIGCRDTLIGLGFGDHDIENRAIPVYASTLDRAFPSLAIKDGIAGYKEMHCAENNLTAPLPEPNREVDKLIVWPLSGEYDYEVSLEKVEEDGYLRYVLTSIQQSYFIDCPAVDEGSLKAAFKFPGEYSVREIDTFSPHFTNARRNPTLNCPAGDMPNPFAQVYRSENDTQNPYYLRVQANDNFLIRFSCSEPLRYFPGPDVMNNPNNSIKITANMVEYLTLNQGTSDIKAQVRTIGCFEYTHHGVVLDKVEFKLRDRHHKLCVKTENNSTNNGAKLVPGDCNEGRFFRMSPTWSFPDNHWENRYRLIDVDSGKCVDLPGGNTDDTQSLQLWDCLNNNNQKFEVNRHGDDKERTFQFKFFNGKCLSNTGFGPNQPATFQYTCDKPGYQHEGEQWNLFDRRL